MSEIGKHNEVTFVKDSGIENFRDIKPTSDISSNEAKSYIGDIFNEIHELEKDYYTDYGDRWRYTPTEYSSNGSWEGDRGESKFVPNEESEVGKTVKERLAEKGLDGIEYHNCEVDFSECAEATVVIDDMTEKRYDYIDSDGNYQLGNFSQADLKCAEAWNSEAKDGKTDWKAEDVESWRKENRCSWHERCDTKTMDLVSRDIHEFFKHSGGCAECRIRDSIDAGGGFDE